MAAAAVRWVNVPVQLCNSSCYPVAHHSQRSTLLTPLLRHKPVPARFVITDADTSMGIVDATEPLNSTTVAGRATGETPTADRTDSHADCVHCVYL